MPGRVGKAGWIAAVVLLGATAGHAQVVAGRVIDATSQAPLRGVTVTMSSGPTSVSARTDDSGSFRARLPAAGNYVLRFRLIGYQPVTTAPIVVPAGDTPVLSNHRLTRLAVTIDTVVTRDDRPTFFSVTPGREIFRRHLLENKGLLIGGLEIQRTKLGLLEFLGMQPGLVFVPGVPTPSPGAQTATSPPTIPSRKGFLLSTHDNKCLYGRIDRWWIIDLMDQYAADGIEDMIDVEDVMAVEVYQSYREIPKDWAFEGSSAVQLIWRADGLMRNYLMGDGTPSLARPSIRANPRDEPYYAPANVGVLPPVGPRAEPLPPGFPSWRVVGASQASRPIFAVMDSVNFERPRSITLPSMIAPSCGFLQIWTRVAW